LADNALLVLLSDNRTTDADDSGLLRGGKTTPFEGKFVAVGFVWSGKR